MKNKIVLVILIALHVHLPAQTVDSVWLARQEQRIIALKQQNDSLLSEFAILTQKSSELEALMLSVVNKDSNIEKRLAAIEKQNYTLSNKLSQSEKSMSDSISELKTQIANNSEEVTLLNEEMNNHVGDLNNQLQQTGTVIQSNENKRHQSVVWGIVIATFLALVSLIVYLLLHIRIVNKSKDIEQLRRRAEDINSQIVERMGKEFDELSKIVSQTNTATSSTEVEPDHSLVKALADRITFMEMTLYRMDSSVKGHKHLTKSIKQMKDNLLANGYEIVDMLGKDYIEGMKVTASFVIDDTLEEGKQIITSITKPQINYKGKMIQAAQITVSQNI